MGFDGLFFGRIDYQDRIPRTAEKNLEMVWEASANLGLAFSRFLLNVIMPRLFRTSKLAIHRCFTT